MRRTVALLFLPLLASLAHSETGGRFAGTYQAITARNPDAESVLILEQKGPLDYFVDLSVVAPNRTHHGGRIQGLARRAGDTVILTKQNLTDAGTVDTSGTCILQIRIQENTARVVNEDGCAFYHGAAASFVEQGANLLRDGS
jgi:hypothetical protein